jgi:hypothetical protein
LLFIENETNTQHFWDSLLAPGAPPLPTFKWSTSLRAAPSSAHDQEVLAELTVALIVEPFESSTTEAIKMLVPSHFLNGLADRAHGPMHLRFIMQPLMAFYLAFRDGKNDAREGKSPYFWSLFRDSEHRRERLLHGWKSIGKVCIAAFVLDVVFQFIVFHRPRFRGGAISAGIILALLPYILLRGPVNRWFTRQRAATEASQDRSRAA